MKNNGSLNRVYRVVWNAATGVWQAVSECAKGQGKTKSSRSRGASLSHLAAGAFVLLPLSALAASLPTGGQIVAGSGSISQSGNTLTVTQGTGQMAANWQSFSIGQGNTVNFVQPSASAVALNRVLGADVSVIQGALNANGQVFLINPNGVLFTPTAQVNAGALVASTLNLSTEDFLSGNYRFSGSSTAGVKNEGNITVGTGGTVALIAARIENTGSITAPQGNVLMGAGTKVRLDLGGPVKLEVEEGALNTLIEQGGAIRADGGLVFLTSKAAGELASSVINHTGITEARSLTTGEQGEIILSSGYSIVNTGHFDTSGGLNSGGNIAVSATNIIEAGHYNASGDTSGGNITLTASNHIEQTAASTLKADSATGAAGSVRIEAGNDAYLSGSSSASGAQGGEIAITAPRLILADATLTATGETAGGRIRVGGGWQGNDTDLVNADTTYVVAGSMDVSATQNGAGGTAVLWSETATTFGGNIKATGGLTSGNGGQVEISSHGQLNFGGTVDAKAFNGQNGTLLLDPKNIEIVASVASGLSILSLPDPTPGANEQFGGSSVVELMNGTTAMNRIAVASQYDSTVAFGAGAVHLYDSQTGALLSTLTGSTAGDNVGSGGITVLSNGSYVVRSTNWDNGAATNAGAVTWGNGSTGISGVVSASNSLVGSTAGDEVGSSGITALNNGNYVVGSYNWDNGAVVNAGAATWGNGATGINGVLSASNSLVGSKANDAVSRTAITALSNGNYLVISSELDIGPMASVGAVTWGNGTTGIIGTISASNSLVGTQTGDQVGNLGITELSNGNYVVRSVNWNNGAIANAGAVTWGNGSAGISGVVSASNSLVGSTASDLVGDYGITVLNNGNYVVRSASWSTRTGAVTWGNGSSGISGVISASNSLVGSTIDDYVGGYGITALNNGNYVVRSGNWANGAATNVGAVTWGNGSSGISGVVSASNSLVGSKANDKVGSNSVTALSNGNYVVASPDWDNGPLVNAGAVTWGNGTTGISGTISASNSLVGSWTNDMLGNKGVTALSNGNYLAISTEWDNGALFEAGAVTWGNGITGISGTISASNSLIGDRANGRVGNHGVTELSNGHYVVSSGNWSGVGAVSWGNGTTGSSGVVSVSNSLVGSTLGDFVGSGGVTALNNGNYVVSSKFWDDGAATDAGAVTWGNGTTGTSGVVSASNSLVGSSANDHVGGYGITALNNGNYVVNSYTWTNGAATNAGAVT